MFSFGDDMYSPALDRDLMSSSMGMMGPMGMYGGGMYGGMYGAGMSPQLLPGITLTKPLNEDQYRAQLKEKDSTALGVFKTAALVIGAVCSAKFLGKWGKGLLKSMKSTTPPAPTPGFWSRLFHKKPATP